MEGFTTALITQVPNDEPLVQLVNRGHPPPLVLHEGRTQAFMPTSPLPPLGLEDLTTGPPAKPESYPFVAGHRLLLYTDGVTEARNPGNDFFPLPETIGSICSSTTPREFLEQRHQALIRQTEGHLADDVTMILVDRLDERAGMPVI
ncbi:PP2C family protein-serine/threonine phosphatase [Streptomyces sp. NPDC002133]|uniref:PP2C family protein-serine/threonine phosphatase n=1 Tax=Streptomyces sp. NPDC002133 TaxID=3154409 RepID=UPI003320F4BE